MEALWIAVVAGLLVETLTYFAAPGLLARLAFLPVAEHAWSTVTARGALPAAAPLPEDDEAVGRWEGEMGWLRLKYRWSTYRGRFQAVARIDAYRRGAQVVLEAKMWPLGTVGLVVALPVLAIHFWPRIGMAGVAATTVILIAVTVANTHFCRRRLEDSVGNALYEVERRLR